MDKNRKRPHQIKIWMSTAELKHLKSRIKKSGMTQQALIMNALLDIRMTTPEELEQLRIANDHLKEISQNMRAIGNNINQIARHANQYLQVSTSDIEYVQRNLENLNKEVNELWRYSRFVLARLQGTRR